MEGALEDAPVFPAHHKQGLVLRRHTQTGGCKEGRGEGQRLREQKT